jgi:hypothetical protein
MYCPVCKTEYRRGFNNCSDCHVELVDVLPLNDSPKSFSVLWSGENTAFQDNLLQKLELAKIGAVGIPRHVLFRNTDNLFGGRREPRFGFAVCVQSADMTAASRILECLLEEEPGESTPEAAAIPFSTEEVAITNELPVNWNPATASIEVWKGEKENQLKFIEDSLSGVGVPTRRIAERGEPFRLMVRPQDEARGKEVVRQIHENTVPEQPLPADTSYAWMDEPVQSYSLMWITGAAYFLLLFMGFSFPDLKSQVTSVLGGLLMVATFAANLGSFWMLYQSVRYEIRPLSFILFSFIPFSFVWYYFQRYSKRTGVRRLPVAMRVRLSPPPSA